MHPHPGEPLRRHGITDHRIRHENGIGRIGKSRTLSYVSIPLFSANASNAAVICSRRLPPGAKYASIETVPAPSPSEA